MGKVNLNELIWGVKTKNYFFFSSISLTIFSLFHLLAFVDYFQLRSDATDDDYYIFWNDFMFPVVFKWAFAILFLLILICPFRLYYGCILVFLSFWVTSNIVVFLLYRIHAYDPKDTKLDKFPAGQVGLQISYYGAHCCYIFMIIILFKVSICKVVKEDQEEGDIYRSESSSRSQIYTEPDETI